MSGQGRLPYLPRLVARAGLPLLVVGLALGATVSASGLAVPLRAVHASPAPPPAFVVAAATRLAAALGDSQPTSAQYVLTRHKAAVYASSGAIVMSNQPVYLIVLTGHFKTGPVGPPPGGHVVTGSFANEVLDAANGATDSGLGSHPVPIRSLGLVGDLLPYMQGTARPACSAPDLHATAGFQGATGSELGGIVVRNDSGLACTLPSPPLVDLSWADRLLPVSTTPFPSGWLRRMNPRWAQSVSVLAPGAKAQVVLQWFNWCGATPWGHDRAIHLTVALRVPHQPAAIEATTSDLVSTPFCNLKPRTGSGSTLRVSPFVETS